MKRAIAFIFSLAMIVTLIIPLTAWQNTPTIGVLPDSGPALPATCVVGQLYFKTTATVGLNQCATANTWTAVGGGGTGTVTNTGGALTANAVVLGAGGNDTKVAAGFTTDGTSDLTLGVGATSSGNIVFATSANNTAFSVGTGTSATSGAALGFFPNTFTPTTNPTVVVQNSANNGYAGLSTVSTAGYCISTSSTNANGNIGECIGSTASGVLSADTTSNGNGQGKLKAAGYMSVGTTFTSNAGCSETSLVGGATAGKYASGTTGTCTVVITMGSSSTAPNGWACAANDLTTVADTQKQSATTTTTATITGTTVSGDVINFHCLGY